MDNDTINSREHIPKAFAMYSTSPPMVFTQEHMQTYTLQHGHPRENPLIIMKSSTIQHLDDKNFFIPQVDENKSRALTYIVRESE